MIDFGALVPAAQRRIGECVRHTPLERSDILSELTGANVFLKLENLQVTGSFKARGAFNRLLAMSDEERARGYVTASSGNHGTAVAYAAKELGIHGITFVPEGASPLKIDNIRRLGGTVETYGAEGGATEIHARAYAEWRGMTYVSPYNDPLVIAGQGTIGAELAIQAPSIDVVVASVGGGGLICGIAGFLKTQHRNLRVIGASPEASMAMAASVRAGHIVETEHRPTLSDGTAGGLEPGAITFALCQSLVDQFVEVTEAEIKAALRMFIESHHMLCEGAAAVALAGVLKEREHLSGKNIVIIICGANISADRLKQAL
jgi:threonine dehydratase